MPISSYLDKLNADQRHAVELFERPVLVLAGSGTGKTELLVAKFITAVSRGIAPERIMAVTFTRKAAAELRSRVARQIPNLDPSTLWIGTFHSLSARILRASPNLSPIGTDFTTLEASEQAMVIAQVLRSIKHESVNTERSLQRKTKEIGALIDRLKNDGTSIPTVLAQNRHDQETAGILRTYEEYLRERRTADFGDLIVSVIEMLATNNAASTAWKDRFQVIEVDEYQDVNTAQGMWIDAIRGPSTSLTCLGDDDQVIYQWRGANPDYILNFGLRYPDAEIVTLRTNYRSPQPIVDAARLLISNNASRYEKTVIASEEGGASNVIQVHPHSFTERHSALLDTILVESIAYPWNEMMVLTRNNAEAGEIAGELSKANIPVNLVKQSASESDTMQTLLAWLRILRNPHDVPAFARCMKLGENDPLLRNLWMRSMMLSKTIIEATVEQIESGRLTEEGAINFIGRYRNASRVIQGQSPIDALHTIIDQCGFIHRLESVMEDERLQFITLFQELATHAHNLRTFAEIADIIQIQAPAHSRLDGITVSTMHGVKGLEAPVVCSTGWSAKRFPRSLTDHDIEEQRRLAFVTVTRSSQRVHLFYEASEGPGAFLYELGLLEKFERQW